MTKAPTEPVARAAEQAARVARGYVERRRSLRLVAGVALLGIGLLGLLMPILPGWLLIFVGLALLGVRPQFVERFKESALRKKGGSRGSPPGSGPPDSAPR